jgi:hypothetical protein
MRVFAGLVAMGLTSLLVTMPVAPGAARQTRAQHLPAESSGADRCLAVAFHDRTARRDRPSDFRAITASGTSAYVVEGSPGSLWVAHLGTHTPLRLRGHLAYEPGNPDGRTLAVRQDQVYAVTRNQRLLQIDASDPDRPVQVADLSTLAPEAWELQVVGDLLYVLSTYSGNGNRLSWLYVLDVGDPAAPVALAELRLGSRLPRMAASNHHLYFHQGNSLLVVDVTNPLDPTLRPTVTLPWPDHDGTDLIDRYERLWVGDGAVFIARTTEMGLLQVVALDPSDPDHPRLAADRVTDAVTVLAVSGRRLLLDGQALDFAELDQPVRERYVPAAPEFAGNALVLPDGDLLTSEAGLTRYRLAPDAPCDSPAPASGGEPSDGPARVYLPILPNRATASGAVPGLPAIEAMAGGAIAALATEGDIVFAAQGERLVTLAIEAGRPVVLGRTVALGAPLLAVAVAGRTVYAGDLVGGLHAFDASDPASLRMLGRHTEAGAITSLAVVGSRLWAGVGGEVVVLDTTDPARPRSIARRAFSTHMLTVQLATVGHLVVVLAVDRFFVLDSADESLTSLARVWTRGCRQWAAADTTFYCAGNGAQGYDVRDPSQPRLGAELSDSATAVTLLDGLLYVLEPGRLVVIDPVDLTVERSRSAPELRGQRLARVADTLLMVDGGRITAMDPETLTPLGELADVGGALRLVRSGTLAAMLDEAGQVVVADVARPEAPQPVAWLPPQPLRALDLALSDQQLLVLRRAGAPAEADLEVFDLADARRPALMGRLPLEGVARLVRTRRPYAWLYCDLPDAEASLVTVRVDDPATPEILSTLAVPVQAAGLDVEGGVAVLVGLDPAQVPLLQLVDVTQPDRPRLAGRIALADRPFDVRVHDGLAYVATLAGLVIVDLTRTESPTRLGWLPLDRQFRFLQQPLNSWGHPRVAVLGDRLLLTGADQFVIQISDPAHPRLLARRYEAPLTDVAALDDTGWLAAVSQSGWYRLPPGLPVDGPAWTAWLP